MDIPVCTCGVGDPLAPLAPSPQSVHVPFYKFSLHNACLRWLPILKA